MANKWNVMEAPVPRQIIWLNLPKHFNEREKADCVYVIAALTIYFSAFLIAIISAFATLSNLEKSLPFLKPIVDIAAVKMVLEANLPQISLMVILLLLPKLLLYLSKQEGIPLESHAHRATSGKYFYFVVLCLFIGTTLGGTLLLFHSLKTIEKDPNETVLFLATSLPANATFFLTYVALEFVASYGLELSQKQFLIIYHLKRKFLGKSYSECIKAWRPGDFTFATWIPKDLLVIPIVICYSVIAPIIIPFGVIYFALGWLVHRDQLMPMFLRNKGKENKTESKENDKLIMSKMRTTKHVLATFTP